MNLELKVNRFNNEDVIATSCSTIALKPDYAHSFKISLDEVGNVRWMGDWYHTENELLNNKIVKANGNIVDAIGNFNPNSYYHFDDVNNMWYECTNSSHEDEVHVA